MSSRIAQLPPMRRWLAAAALAAGLSALGWPTSASAHSYLVAISPATGATLQRPPAAVVLRLSAPVDPNLATVRVTDPSGRSVDAGPAHVQGAVVTQPLRTDLVSGPYAVAFRVVSQSDGHPLADVSAFTLDLAPGSRAGTGSSGGPSSGGPSGVGASGSASAGAGTGHSAGPVASGGSAGSDPGSDGTRRLAMAFGVGALALAGGTAVVAASRRRERS